MNGLEFLLFTLITLIVGREWGKECKDDKNELFQIIISFISKLWVKEKKDEKVNNRG